MLFFQWFVCAEQAAGAVDVGGAGGALRDRHEDPLHVPHALQQVPHGHPDLQVPGVTFSYHPTYFLPYYEMQIFPVCCIQCCLGVNYASIASLHIIDYIL